VQVHIAGASAFLKFRPEFAEKSKDSFVDKFDNKPESNNVVRLSF